MFDLPIIVNEICSEVVFGMEESKRKGYLMYLGAIGCFNESEETFEKLSDIIKLFKKEGFEIVHKVKDAVAYFFIHVENEEDFNYLRLIYSEYFFGWRKIEEI